MYRPPGWDKMIEEAYLLTHHERGMLEEGADAMLLALEPIIRDKAPSSSLIDILYGGNDESKA